MISKGIDRATKRAYFSENLFKSIKDSLIDGFKVLPKVVSLLCVIGIASMIIAKNTPVFTWLGYVFLPILNLFNVPDAAAFYNSVNAINNSNVNGSDNDNGYSINLNKFVIVNLRKENSNIENFLVLALLQGAVIDK